MCGASVGANDTTAVWSVTGFFRGLLTGAGAFDAFVVVVVVAVDFFFFFGASTLFSFVFLLLLLLLCRFFFSCS